MLSIRGRAPTGKRGICCPLAPKRFGGRRMLELAAILGPRLVFNTGVVRTFSQCVRFWRGRFRLHFVTISSLGCNVRAVSYERYEARADTHGKLRRRP